MAVQRDEKTGKWYYYGSYKTKEGKTKQYKKRGFEKKKDAVKAEIIFKSNIKEPNKEITLNKLLDMYLKYSETRIKESTYRTLSSIFDKWRIELGNAKVSSITPIRINDICIEFQKVYCFNTVKGYFSKLKMVLEYGVRRGFIGKNPCNEVELRKNPNLKKKEMNYWTVEQFNYFMDHVHNPYYKVLFMNQFYMGTRIGEALALQWKDIDLKARTITINKTWSKDDRKLTTPKTNNSYRTITMPKFLVDEYKSLKRSLSTNSAIKECVSDESFVFGIDRPLVNSTIRTYMVKIIKETNLCLPEDKQIPLIRIHDLRHSCASYMIGNMVKGGESNFSLYDVAKRLGDNLDTVLNVYAHWLPQADKGIARIMDKDNFMRGSDTRNDTI